MQVPKNWFETWFNTPYYHLLYQHRNEAEAALFIANLLNSLNVPQNSRLLDLACGKGRHAQFMAQKGYEVIGLDLSEESIDYAKQFENDRLHFFVHDMRRVFKTEYFDYVFNFFTSFGYFDDEKDNEKTIAAIRQQLKKNGYLVIDFLNAHKIIANLVPQETKIIEGVRFDITRSVENKCIVKRIKVIDEEKNYQAHFSEKVQALTQKDFEGYLTKHGFAIKAWYGNYKLGSFEEKSADRLIVLAQKL